MKRRQLDSGTEIVEDEIQPFIGTFVNRIIKEQSNYEKINKPKSFGGDEGFEN